MIKLNSPTKFWKFPGGEVGVKLEDIQFPWCIIHMDFEGSDDILQLMNLCDALQREYVYDIHLKMPYLPYARQDRKCHSGEAFSLKVFVKLLASIGIKSVGCTDVHSDVAKELFDAYDIEFCNIEQWQIAKNLPEFDYLIAPDLGSHGKASKTWENSFSNLVTLTKTRTESGIVYDDLEDTIDGTAIILDDICDFGGTFLACGAMLKRTQPRMTSLNLYVTHGLLGKGTDALFEIYDKIYVHNLMNKNLSYSDRLIEI